MPLRGGWRWILAGVLLGAAIGLAYLYGFPPDEAASGSTGQVTAGQATPAPVEGSPAPEFSLQNLDGETVALADYRGEVVLLNFWATWCGPCRLEMPVLQDYHSRFSGQGLTVLGVNFDEPREDVAAFQRELNLTFPLLLDPGGAVQDLYRIRGYPSTFVVDRDGMISTVHIGVLAESQVQEYLQQVGIGS